MDVEGEINHSWTQLTYTITVAVDNRPLLAARGRRISTGYRDRCLHKSPLPITFQHLCWSVLLLSNIFLRRPWSKPQCLFYAAMRVIFNVMRLMQEQGEETPLINSRKRTLSPNRTPIYQSDIVTVPINTTNTHWSGIVFSWKLKYMEYCDSCHLTGRKFIEALQDFLIKYMPEDNSFVAWDDWNIEYTSLETPRQLNGYDCGVFWLWTVRCKLLVSKETAILRIPNYTTLPTCLISSCDVLFQGKECNFTQADITRYRNQIQTELILGKIFHSPW